MSMSQFSLHNNCTKNSVFGTMPLDDGTDDYAKPGT